MLRFILMALIFVFYTACYADTIYLQDGTTIDGEIIGIDGDRVTIKTLESTLTISKYRIKKVEEDDAGNEEMEKEKTPISIPGPQWDLKWD